MYSTGIVNILEIILKFTTVVSLCLTVALYNSVFTCVYVRYTVWGKGLTAESFDESKLHRQNFPCQYFALGIK